MIGRSMRAPMESSDGDDETLFSGPLTPEELDAARRARGNPSYTPPPAPDPFLDTLSDNAIVLLSPFLRLTEPPDAEQIDVIMQSHPARVARPQVNFRGYAAETLRLFARLCAHRGLQWAAAGKIANIRGTLLTPCQAETTRHPGNEPT